MLLVVQRLPALVSKLSDQKKVSARPTPAASKSSVQRQKNMFPERFIFCGHITCQIIAD
jgi:hypothetical protein